ncbi:MAG: DNA polymerase IV [Desulfarculaceae bacterium]
MIAHVDMDAFYASVEVLDRPELKGRPVIVGGISDRGVVSAASYEARAFGVRSATPVFQAKRLCPQGVFLKGRMARYQQVSRKVMTVLESFTPVVEPVSVDEAYLDLGGTEGLWGGPEQAGRALKKAVLEATGLTCSVGLAPVRFLAKIASDKDKPDGLTVVEDVERFLAGVKLGEVPGVGAKARARLEQMGLTRLIELRALGQERLLSMMGSFGQRLWELAHGRDAAAINPHRPVKSVSHERTLAQDTDDLDLMSAHLLGMTQKVCRRLRAKGLCGGTVTIKLKHADHRLVTRSKGLERPSDQAEDIYPVARDLLQAYPQAGPFRLIGVGVSNLVTWDRVQAPLLDRERLSRRRALALAEDDLCRRFGESVLMRAAALDTLDRPSKARHNGDK